MCDVTSPSLSSILNSDGSHWNTASVAGMDGGEESDGEGEESCGERGVVEEVEEGRSGRDEREVAVAVAVVVVSV